MTGRPARIHTPRYLLRRNIILHLLRSYAPGRFLEIGCGRGELLPWLLKRGFEGVGLEISPDVLPLARQAVQGFGARARVESEPEAIRDERFQYVLAFEVLEHIEDDAGALREWRDWLSPDGTLVISVPAGMKWWSAADEAGGHYRRYERLGLRDLLESCGYTIDVFWNYGFPVTALTARLRPLLYRRRLSRLDAVPRQERTLRSSLDSTRTLGMASRPVGMALEAGAWLAHLAQLPFRHTDLGDGYLVACRRADGRAATG